MISISAGLAAMDAATYDAMRPVQWPVPAGGESRQRLFADGQFFTAGGKANFIAVAIPHLSENVSDAYPLLLNTGRVRDQWHTMTRTGLSQRLGSHVPEPFVSVHPEDAKRSGLTDGGARTTQQ